jgi:cell division protein FtsQ
MPTLTRGGFGTRGRAGQSLTRQEQAQGLEPRRRSARRRRIVSMTAMGALALGLGVAQLTGVLGAALHGADTSIMKGLVSAGLSVQSIQVTGRHRTDPQALRAALEVARGQSLLHLDLEDMRRRVEALGWVKSAELYRSLPNTLRLEITERQAFALWQYKGKLQLIDGDGTVITSARPEDFFGLPLVVGKGAADDARELESLLADEPALASQVAAAVRVGDRRWNIQFRNGVEVRLPQEHPQAAWARLATLEREHGLLERDIVHVDMRLADRLIIRGKEAPKPLGEIKPSI